MLGSLKRSSYSLSRRLGLSRLVAHSAWRRERLQILCYHGVSLTDEHQWNPSLYVSAAHLERHFQILQQAGCTVLPLAEAVERLYTRQLPERAVVLTFDDGYYDFKARAWPMLQRFRYPATVYLTTARVEHNLPIVNLFISYMLWMARGRTLDGRGLLGLDGRYALNTHLARDVVSASIDRAVQARGMTATEKDAVALQVAERLELDGEALRASRILTLMRPDEIRCLATEGLDVQLHTHLHRTPDDVRAFVDDVLHNRDVIERIVGTRPSHLCYPSGMYRMSYLPELFREGLASATTCDPGIAAPSCEPLLLPRFIDTMSITDVEFEAWVTGVASCLPRRTTKAHPAVH